MSIIKAHYPADLRPYSPKCDLLFSFFKELCTLSSKNCVINFKRGMKLCKRNKFSLKTVRGTLVAGLSYSTVPVCIASLVFVVLTINCGSPSKTQYYVPEAAATTAAKTMPTDSRNTDSRLPKGCCCQFTRVALCQKCF